MNNILDPNITWKRYLIGTDKDWFNTIGATCALIGSHYIAYMYLSGKVDGSIFSNVRANDYHDGLVMGDCTTVMTILADIYLLYWAGQKIKF